MNVLLLTDYPPELERAPSSRLLFLGCEMAKDGHHVRVVGSATANQAGMAGIEVSAVQHVGQGGLKQAMFPFRSQVRREIANSDAIVVRGYWIGFFSLWLARRLKKRVRICDFHGFVWQEQRGNGRWLRAFVTRILETWALRFATTIVCVSEGVKKGLDQRFREKAIVLENGVQCAAFDVGCASGRASDVRQKLGLAETGPVFAMVAHSGPWLDLKVVVKAAALVQGVDIVIAGDGAGLEEAKAGCLRENIRNVRFPGIVSQADVRTLLTEVCAGCLCPYDAAWIHANEPNFFASRKVKEYLAAGRPVIVSDVAGRGEFLVNGETCLTFRAGDASDLAGKMKHVIESPEAAMKIGSAARVKAKEFDWAALYKSSGLRGLLAQVHE